MNKISTTKLSLKYDIDRDKLIKYLLEINYVERDEKNRMSLTEIGINNTGEYFYTDEGNKYIVWSDNLLGNGHDLKYIDQIEIAKEVKKIEKKENKKSSQYNHQNLDLKRDIKSLVDQQFNVNEISSKLAYPVDEILKIITGLPRIKSEYIKYHGSVDFLDLANESNSFINTENIDLENNKEILKILITGFNPITGEELDKDCIINEPKIRKSLLEIYQTIENLDKSTKSKQKNKLNIDDEIPLDNEQFELYEKLRSWRYQTSLEISVPPYILATNKVLRYIAIDKPVTIDELSTIKGIKINFLQDYGDEVIKIIKSLIENETSLIYNN